MNLKVIKPVNGSRKEENIKYIIDLEEYDGFAMIKYYPRHLKNDKNKFKCRGIGKSGHSLKYFVPRNEMLKIMHECVSIMKDYLKFKKFRFVGFIGMVDDVDNSCNRLNSQRYNIYSPFTYSAFNKSDYIINNVEILQYFNCLMVANNLSNGLSKLQKKNYNKFLGFIDENLTSVDQIMTSQTILNLRENT